MAAAWDEAWQVARAAAPPFAQYGVSGSLAAVATATASLGGVLGERGGGAAAAAGRGLSTAPPSGARGLSTAASARGLAAMPALEEAPCEQDEEQGEDEAEGGARLAGVALLNEGAQLELRFADGRRY